MAANTRFNAGYGALPEVQFATRVVHLYVEFDSGSAAGYYRRSLRGFFPIDNLMRRALSREAIPHLEQS